MIRNAFNIAACLTGAAVASTQALFISWALSDSSGGWINLQPQMTGAELAANTTIGLAGLGLFSLGYTRFFGSGKTIATMRAAVNKFDKPPKP